MSIGEWFVLGFVLGLSFIAFILVIVLGYAKNKNLDRGEMRRAITAFFIILFGLLVAAGFFLTRVDVPDEINGLFFGTITTIIGFYYGSRSSQTKPPDDTVTTPPVGSGPQTSAERRGSS